MVGGGPSSLLASGSLGVRWASFPRLPEAAPQFTPVPVAGGARPPDLSCHSPAFSCPYGIASQSSSRICAHAAFWSVRCTFTWKLPLPMALVVTEKVSLNVWPVAVRTVSST